MGISPVPLLLSIPLSLHLGYIAVFGVAFLYSGNLWSFLYYGASSLWVGLSLVACEGFLVWEACVGVLVGGAGFLLWSAMNCPVMSYEMSMVLE